MKTLSGLLCLLLGSAVLADTITTPGGIVIDGADVKSVIVATKFPVTVTAPTGGVLYQWDVPASVKTKRTKGASLVVDEAAPGETVLSVTYAVVDFEKKTVEEKTATLTFTAGGVQPPPVPPDDGVIVPPLMQQSFNAAYASDPDPQKKARTLKLADYLASTPKFLKDSGTVTTHEDFDAKMHAGVEAYVGKKAEGAIVVVRQAISDWNKATLPRDAKGLVDAAYWNTVITMTSQEAKALKGAAK